MHQPIAEHALTHASAEVACIGPRISIGCTRVHGTENAHTQQVNAANACMYIALRRYTPCRCGRSSAWPGWFLGTQRGQARQICCKTRFTRALMQTWNHFFTQPRGPERRFRAFIHHGCGPVQSALETHRSSIFAPFWFLVCYTATQLATSLQQRRIQVVHSNKVARKRLTESNGTPTMDFGCEEIRKRRYTQTKNRTQHINTIVI